MKIAIVLMLVTGIQAAQAQRVQPLTLEGKTALYQRVIAVPGAMLHAMIEGSDAGSELVVPFTVFYVYAREIHQGQEWLQVGTESNGQIDGWLAAEDGINWKQTLTVSFKDPAIQERVIFFGERAALKQLVEGNDAAAYQQLQRQAEEGITENSPVIAIQPETYVNIRRNFYLVPILSHEDVLVGAHQGRMLHVASVPLRDPFTAYRAGIVFVIDATISMGPYIDRTRAIMQRLYAALGATELSDQLGFGLVAFRDSTTAVPGLEFVTRLYANPGGGTSGEEFLSKIQAVEPASASSKDFNEDAYAGVKQAIEEIEWKGFDARYIILITDAGPRISGDPLAATGLDTESLRRLASDNGIALWVMHLRTPVGIANHPYAEEQYRRLSHISDIGDFYYPVEAGDVDSFETALAAMTEQLTDQVGDARGGFAPKGVAAGAKPDTADDLSAFQERAAQLGYALRMRYLEGKERTVPRLFNAWMIDRKFSDPSERAVDVRVLLTRDQLSDLHEVLSQVLLAAEEGALAPQDFLGELQSLAATISRDPEAVKTTTRTSGSASLADLGYMREYIEGLPYLSDVMDLDLSTWQQWSAQRQFEFVNKLDGKIAYYRALHDNVDLWVSLDGGPVDGDSVYPLLLEALP